MMRWLDDNPLGKALAAVSAGLAVVLLLLALAWSLPPRGAVDDDADGGRGLAVAVPDLAEPAPIDQFAVIMDRPVFNESRLPEDFSDEGEGAEEQGAEVAAAEVEAPDVTLSGIVITPTQRWATLRPKGSPESLVAEEGSPLEGDYGSWHVSAIQPRSVVLRSGAGEEVELALQVHDEVIAEPPKPAPVARPDEAGAQDGGEGDPPPSRAEEIRQRIAERREELRRAAEENEQVQPRRPGYNSAIQQLIQGKRTDTEDEKPE
jgi:hypothetical protein